MATPPLCSRRRVLPASKTASRSPAGLLDALLDRRIIFVAGKGGTGKTTVAAAFCLLAAQRGKEVLGVEVDAKGDLSAALGSKGASFKAEVVQPGISVLALHAEESFQEYLRLYFKVPRLARITPLARVFDFIATAVPGPRDMLVTGKIAFEERRRDDSKRPVWDLIVVDCSASGHVLAQLRAARSMLELVRGGHHPQPDRMDRLGHLRRAAHHRGADRAARGDAGRGDDRAEPRHRQAAHRQRRPVRAQPHAARTAATRRPPRAR